MELVMSAAPVLEDRKVKTRVLVVDDDTVSAKVVTHQLECAGFLATYVLSGSEALHRLETDRYDVLLADICMPAMRGEELQRLAHKLDPDIAVLFITGTKDVYSAVDCMREGAFDYLVKPVPRAALMERVGKAADHRREQKASKDYRVDLEHKAVEAAEHTRLVFNGFLESLAKTLNAKDEETRDHSGRVSELAASLAALMRPNDLDFVAQVRVGSLFHDIGKIGVSEAILSKPGPLTFEEEAEIRKHPEIGESILRPIFDGSEVLAIVRHHHEQINGRGYPDGLAGSAISLGARIVAVADSYDAMTHSRPYRPGMTPDHAAQILVDGAGTQWDANVVNTLLGALARDERVARAFKRRDAIVFVDSELNRETVDKLQGRVEVLRRQGASNFILDLSNADRINQNGAQALWSLHEEVFAEGGHMSIRDIPEQALFMFRELGMANKLTMERTPIRKDNSPPGSRTTTIASPALSQNNG